MLQVTVKRSQWLRGEGSMASLLLREDDGKMCCLGFAALAAGLTAIAITQEATVAKLAGHHVIPDSLDMLVSDTGMDTEHANDLMDMNDIIDTEEAYREQQIKLYGEAVGIDFTFVD